MKLNDIFMFICTLAALYIIDIVLIHWNIVNSKLSFEELSETSETHLPPCSTQAYNLFGREKPNLAIYEYDQLEDKFKGAEIGGRWRPKNCKAEKRVAIIIPFRDRDIHLRQLLNNLIPKLRRQKVDYTFYVVEQDESCRFNRGMIRNIGFVEARKQAEYDCYIFNDVDTVTESDFNFFTCKQGAALTMVTSMDRFNYKLFYPTFIGSVISVTEELLLRANGYSNFFFMWGREDDDLWRRICDNVEGIIERPPPEHGYASAFPHERPKISHDRLFMMDTVVSFSHKDGLNTLNYTLKSITKSRLFTRIVVGIDEEYYTKMLDVYKSSWNEQKSNYHKLLFGDNDEETVSQGLRKCSIDYSSLHGREKVELSHHDYEDMEKLFSDTEIGGRWRPKDCTARRRVAIIIPFEKSHRQLQQLLHNLIPKLRRQNVDYTFYIIEQGCESRFNRGAIKNIGFKEARKHAYYDCYVFNDVHAIIESDFNFYTCDFGIVLHISCKVDTDNYTVRLPKSISGILSFPEDIFMRVNGFSNFYFESEKVDDDMNRRIKKTTGHGGRVDRPFTDQTHTTILQHDRIIENQESIAVFESIFPFVHKDGYNSLKYIRNTIKTQKLFTWINVEISESYYNDLLSTYKRDLADESRVGI